MAAVESRSECAVREWNSTSAVDCQGLDHVMRDVAAMTIHELVDARAVTVATLQSVRQHLADDLVVLLSADRSRLRMSTESC